MPFAELNIYKDAKSANAVVRSIPTFFLLSFVLLLVSCGGGDRVADKNTVVITTRELPQWEPGAATFALQAAGGTPPYTWALVPGSALPPGFTLGTNGVIGGTVALNPGTSKSVSPPFEVFVQDSAGKADRVSLSMIIVEGSLAIIPAADVVCPNKSCNVQIATATGGSPPYHFQSDTFREGPPPLGMTIDLNGMLSGTTKKAGDYLVGVCVTDTVAASKCTKVPVKVEESVAGLDGVWVGTFSEISTSSYCKLKDAGSKTFRIKRDDERSFSGTIEYSGVSTVLSGENCEGDSYSGTGTVSGVISGNEISGTMAFQSYDEPFTATLEGDTLSGTYSYSTDAYGSPMSATGEFTLRRT